jgi:hypothetical protein
MKHLAETLWENAKPAGEFVAGIVAIVAVLYGLSSMADDIFVHIHVDHHWWAYHAWHTLWWVIVPLMMVGIGWPFRRRALGGGLWAMGAVWMLFLGCAFGMMIFVEFFKYASNRLGILVGTALSLVAVLLLGICSAVWGRLAHQVRNRLSR